MLACNKELKQLWPDGLWRLRTGYSCNNPVPKGTKAIITDRILIEMKIKTNRKSAVKKYNQRYSGTSLPNKSLRTPNTTYNHICVWQWETKENKILPSTVHSPKFLNWTLKETWKCKYMSNQQKHAQWEWLNKKN